MFGHLKGVATGRVRHENTVVAPALVELLQRNDTIDALPDVRRWVHALLLCAYSWEQDLFYSGQFRLWKDRWRHVTPKGAKSVLTILTQAFHIMMAADAQIEVAEALEEHLFAVLSAKQEQDQVYDYANEKQIWLADRASFPLRLITSLARASLPDFDAAAAFHDHMVFGEAALESLSEMMSQSLARQQQERGE